MNRRILPGLAIAVAAIVPALALAQSIEPRPAQAYQLPDDDDDRRYDRYLEDEEEEEEDQLRYEDDRYGVQRGYAFDRSLLGAVDGCARRAARANLGRVSVVEAARVRASRYQVVGNAIQAPLRDRRYGGPEANWNWGLRVGFRCTADAWGRVSGWEVFRS
jgi:hypothetical protein